MTSCGSSGALDSSVLACTSERAVDLHWGGDSWEQEARRWADVTERDPSMRRASSPGISCLCPDFVSFYGA